MSAVRRRLPNRRDSVTYAFEHAGQHFVATVSTFDDGSPAELFLNNGKINSQLGALCRDAAIAVSFALQHGADAQAIRRALLRDGQGRAQTAIGGALDAIIGEEGAS